MADTLTLRGDEGRGVTAIRSGEVSSNLRSGDVRMGKPDPRRADHSTSNRGMRTQGSETSQYLVEKKIINYSLSSGERNGKSPNSRRFSQENWRGGCKVVMAQFLIGRRVKKCFVSRSRWEAAS